MSKFIDDIRVYTRQTEKESYPLKGQRKKGRHGRIVWAIFNFGQCEDMQRPSESQMREERKDVCTTSAEKIHEKKKKKIHEMEKKLLAETDVHPAFCPQTALQKKKKKKTILLHCKWFFYIVWNFVMKTTSHHASSHDRLSTRSISLLHLPNRFMILYCTYQMHLTCHSMTQKQVTTGTNPVSLFCWFKKRIIIIIKKEMGQ